MRFATFSLVVFAVGAFAQSDALDPRPQSLCTAVSEKIQCYHPDGVMSDQCCDSSQGETMCCGTGCATVDYPCIIMPNEDVKVCFKGEDCGASASLTGSAKSTKTIAISRSSSSQSASSTAASAASASASATGSDSSSTTSSSGSAPTNAAGMAVAAMVMGAAVLL